VREKRTRAATNYLADGRTHPGRIEMVFVHWLKVIGAAGGFYQGRGGGSGTLAGAWYFGVNAWLNSIKDFKPMPPGFTTAKIHDGALGSIVQPHAQPPPAWQFIRISELLYGLVEQVTPGSLFGIGDHRLHAPDSLSLLHSGNGALEMRTSVTNGNVTTKSLAEIWIPIRMCVLAYADTTTNMDHYDVLDSPLFEMPDRNGQVGPMSLYNIKNLAEAIERLSAEFFFKYGVEIPTMDEAAQAPLALPNFPYDRMSRWMATVRWMFQSVDEAIAYLYLDPNEDTIEPTPAAQWLTNARYDLPTPKDTGPDHYEYSFGYDEDLQNDFSGKLLFRTTAAFRPTLSTLTFQPSGCELYLGPDEMHLGDIQHGSGTEQGVIVEFGPPGVKGHTMDWGEYHAYLHMMRWGNCRAQVEFDHHGRGIEPFGASAKNLSIKPKATFNLHDIGDFPLLRHFDLKTGLLPRITYAIQEITVAPKKPTHIKAIEIVDLDNEGSPLNVRETEDPPYVPPPPTLRVEGPTTGTSITGGSAPVTIAFEVIEHGEEVSSVKIFIDNNFLDYAEANALNTYSFTWDTTGLPLGAHVITIVAYDVQGQFGTATINVTLT
jgi:hypothetical protein